MWVIKAHRGAVNSPTVLLAAPQIWRNVWWLGDFTALSWFLDALMGHMNIYPRHSSPRSQYMLTKELHVRNRQNESKDLVTQWSQRIVLCFVIWITEPMGQETESPTVGLTLTFSRRKQCRRSPSNHTLIQSERLNAQGNEERCAVSQYTPTQPMKASESVVFFRWQIKEASGLTWKQGQAPITAFLHCSH